MSDTVNPVHVLQHHLRQAGALIAAKQYDSARAHIDAALALDPASLAALTLRDRIETRRPAAESSPEPVPVPAARPVAPARFVPSGVDAASWLDFEQRVEERRFRALLNGAQRAIDAGDAISARAAIEEARELRPDAYELSQLSGRVALLPSAPLPAHIPYHRSRSVRAVSMLAVGVMLLLGVDWARSVAPSGVLDLTSGVSDLTAKVHGVGPAEPAAPVAPPLSSSFQVAAPSLPPERPVESAAPSSEPVGTAGGSVFDPQARVVSAPREQNRRPDEARVAAVEPATVPAASLPEAESPDVDVAPRRVVVQDADIVPQIVRTGEPAEAQGFRPAVQTPRDTLRAEGSQAGAANVVRQPSSVIEMAGTAPVVPRSTSTPVPPPPPAPSAVPAAAASAAVAAAAVDQTRVQTVLERYARAYGQLDARAVRAVWPSVDERALARAFGDLASQSVSFDTCEIDVRGATATAACRGKAHYVTKIGSQNIRTESRTVRFALTRSGEDWKIDRAETRR